MSYHSNLSKSSKEKSQQSVSGGGTNSNRQSTEKMFENMRKSSERVFENCKMTEMIENVLSSGSTPSKKEEQKVVRGAKT